VLVKWRSDGGCGGAVSLKHAVAVLMDGTFRVVLELV